MRFSTLRILPLIAACCVAGFYWGCGSDDDDDGGKTGTGGSGQTDSGTDTGTGGKTGGSGGGSSGSGGTSGGSGGTSGGSGGTSGGSGGGGTDGGGVVQGSKGTITVSDDPSGKKVFIAAFDKYDPADRTTVPWFTYKVPGAPGVIQYEATIGVTGKKYLFAHLNLDPKGTCVKATNGEEYCYAGPEDPQDGPYEVMVTPSGVITQNFNLVKPGSTPDAGEAGAPDTGTPAEAGPADASTGG